MIEEKMVNVILTDRARHDTAGRRSPDWCACIRMMSR